MGQPQRYAALAKQIRSYILLPNLSAKTTTAIQQQNYRLHGPQQIVNLTCCTAFQTPDAVVKCHHIPKHMYTMHYYPVSKTQADIGDLPYKCTIPINHKYKINVTTETYPTKFQQKAEKQVTKIDKR